MLLDTAGAFCVVLSTELGLLIPGIIFVGSSVGTGLALVTGLGFGLALTVGSGVGFVLVLFFPSVPEP